VALPGTRSAIHRATSLAQATVEMMPT